MLRKIILTLLVLAAIGFAGFWFLTEPKQLAAADLPAHTPDLANGEYMFWAAGCESCHAAPGATGDDLLKLAGGRPLASPFGTFHAPNISPDPEHGIGQWSEVQFVNAMKYGVRADGAHLYPAFPYTSYQRMKMEDIRDLYAYMRTLPPVATDPPPHDLPFPFSFRRGVGLWKLLYVDGETYVAPEGASAAVARGGYLVRGPGHCAECHTPRNFFGGLMESVAFSGGPHPAGKSAIPNITPHKTGIGDWSEGEIVELLTTGFTPTFDSVGGDMALVVLGTAKLTAEDKSAIAAYLKSLAPVDHARGS